MDAVRYIIEFLLYGNAEAAQKVAYVPTVDPNVPICILGQGLEGELHYPQLQHPEVEQLPNGHYVVHTDIVYNTFFFISRAEEVIQTHRDEHGRFMAADSFLQSNDLYIPLVDEYSRILMKLLDLPLPKPGYEAIHLTHDIDTIAHYRHFRGALGGIRRGQWKNVKASLRDLHNDPAYTFPWLMEQDAKCRQDAECIYFVKDTRGKGKDYPQYNLHGKDYLTTAQHLLNNSHLHTRLGLHSSSYEKEPIAYRGDAMGVDYTLHRSHYLACSIERMQQLADAGYTDDYTMGYADQAGFRLQTSRAVRWINPLTRQLTSLTLHPLTLMDCTLSNSNYMHLNEEEAFFVAAEMIDKVRQHHGEVNLLWHNSNFGEGTYHASLYSKILQLL